jgi:hypothetical protein
MQQLADVIDINVGAGYLPLINLDTQYVETTVKDLASFPGTIATANANAGTGGNASASLPANVSFCMTARTGFVGRSYRGRLYGFPIGVTELSGTNTVTASYANLMQTWLTNQNTAADALGWKGVVLSYYTGGMVRSLPIATPISVWLYRNLTTDSQRGRLPSNH